MRILIVDDNDENLYVLQVLLKSYGYEVEMAVNGEEALKKARQDPPALVISDILMPIMDGFALCRHWKQDETLKQIPFVIYTATYTDPRDEQFALKLGAERFIVKPAEPDTFMSIIGEVLKERETGNLIPKEQPETDDEEAYLRQHNEALFRKLKDKIDALQAANRTLEQEISERRRTEAKLLDSIKKNKALLYELYHRTHNNMQMVNSLLVLDAQDYDNPQVEEFVQRTENRLQAMALVHHMLYQSKDLSRLSIKEYVETLASMLIQKHRSENQKISLDTQVEEISILIDTAIPFGLVLNELISNSLKHGFAGQEGGTITIQILQKQGESISMTYADSGSGISEACDWEDPKTFGFKLVKMIVEEQMQGKLSIKDQNGFSIDIDFSDSLYTERV